MAIYTVHLPPGGLPPEAAADRIRFVKDGASLWALLFPLPWLIVKGLWAVLLGWLLAAAALNALSFAGFETAGGVLAVAFALWFALEARDLERWTLDRRGWRLAAVVEGADLDAAERRFFTDWLERGGADASPQVPPPAAPRTGSPPTRPPHAAPSGVIGLFPGAGGR